MITTLSRLLGYRIALYCEEHNPCYSLRWTELPESDSIASGLYRQVLDWEGPTDPFLRNLDEAFRKALMYSGRTSFRRSDIVTAFYQCRRTVLFVHRNIDRCLLLPCDISMDQEFWDEFRAGKRSFSIERYAALKLAIECDNWEDAYYIYFRIMDLLGQQEETYSLPNKWLSSYPMSNFLEGIGEKTLKKITSARDKQRAEYSEKRNEKNI